VLSFTPPSCVYVSTWEAPVRASVTPSPADSVRFVWTGEDGAGGSAPLRLVRGAYVAQITGLPTAQKISYRVVATSKGVPTGQSPSGSAFVPFCIIG
jgi:hypothetical protein